MWDLKKTSAQRIAGELKRKGKMRVDIRGADIEHIYERLRLLSGVPDFSSVAKLLPKPVAAFPDLTGPVLGVIVETRKHSNLEFVVQSFSRRLGIPIRLFHGSQNREFILQSAIGSLVERNEVALMQLDTDRLSENQYNALFLTPDFWGLLQSNCKVLVFQTDAVLCEGSPYTLDDFMAFDYIGSKWPRDRPVGLLMDGGNGGLSLRDWKKSCECLRRFPPQLWTGGEDGYFAFHIDLIGGRVGRPKDCGRFGTQHYFASKSFGAHEIDKLEPQSLAAFLEYCPEARRTLRR